MGNIWIAIVAAIALNGCVSAPKFSDEEKTAAGIKYKSCLYATALRMDDGRSDAGTIGLAAVPQCDQEFQQWLNMTLAGVGDPVTAEIVRHKMELVELETATAAVLEERKSR